MDTPDTPPQKLPPANNAEILKHYLEEVLAKAEPFEKRNGKFDPRIHLLFVEDHHFVHQTVSLLLNEPHYRLRFARTAHEAIQMYFEKPPHIVFIDIGLPDLSGLEVMRLITQYDPQAYAVVLTGSSEMAHITAAREFHAKNYIKKPFNRQQLVACIQRYRDTF